MAVEQARTVLIGDAQGIAETACDRQRSRLAFAFQQRVGGHGGAHLDGLDLRHGNRLAGGHAHQVADAGNGGVAVLLGIFGQQFMRAQAAIGLPRNDVSKRTASIYPELPIHANLAS